MRIRIGQILPGLAATALLFAGSYLQAQTTTNTYSYQLVQPATLAEWSHDFIFPQFDPALGTLDSVRITASYAITTSGSLFNTEQRSKVFWFQGGSQFSLNLPGSLGALNVSSLGQELRYRLPALGSDTYGPYSTNSSVQLTFSGGDLASFLGTGAIDLLGQTSTQELLRNLSGGGRGQIDIALTTTSSAIITLEYVSIDTLVPEPSPVALLALGGLLLLRKRNQPRAAHSPTSRHSFSWA